MRRGSHGVRSIGFCHLLTLLALGVGCGDLDKATDDDGEMLQAKGLLAGGQVTDAIAPDDGDGRDWREITHFEAAKIRVVYHIGDPFAGHDVRGVIEAYDSAGSKLMDRGVLPGQRDYELEFVVEPNHKYFLVFNATEGSSSYLIDVAAESLDPCADCRDDEECVRGRCVLARRGCDPPCDDGEECEEGECVPVGCPRGEYMRRGRCAKDPCYRACDRGERCRRLGGGGHRCVSKAPKCSPACGGDEVCRSGTCVPRSRPAPDPPAGECSPACKKGFMCKGGKCEPSQVTGRILNYWPEGGRTVMLIDKGSQHGLKKGLAGYLKGGTVRIMEVFPFQCRASTKLTAEQLAGQRRVTFKLK